MISAIQGEVEILLSTGEVLLINSEGNDSSLLKLKIEDAQEAGEEPIQLRESCTYEYALPETYSLKASTKGIIRPSKRLGHSHLGRILPGIYVGRLNLAVCKDDEVIDEIGLEVRSSKTDYRTDYRKMLEDIAGECTELMMIHTSPVTQRFTIDYEADAQTLYQRFAFVKAIVDTDDFHNAVQRVISMPVSTWSKQVEDRDIRRARRITSSQLKQIASRKDRIPLPPEHPLNLESIPARLTAVIKIDTLDTPENRFVKHALQEFWRFCGIVRRRAYKDDGQSPVIYTEAKILEERLGAYLNHAMFREISNPTSLPLNSPVLQRKEGYREILRVWLMFDLAAKLVWHVFDDEYQAGKRDVATIYEYWLFFKLLGLVQEIFAIEPAATAELIRETKDGLGLQLKAGKHYPIKGQYLHKGRKLEIQFSYNRTFSNSAFPAGGSWTKQMRPDYTLSLWPAEFSQKEAEEQELIVHIHFDAKYKVEGIKQLLSYDTETVSEEEQEGELNTEKEEQKKGTYKRADLLKMHAYKDAIRRTAGAYLLYPGEEGSNEPFKGFHEIIPGLGAFTIAPKADGEDLGPLRKFLEDVLEHYSNRASQHEELSYRVYDIHRKSPSSSIQESLPEAYNGKRVEPMSEVSVLVGYYHKDQYPWIVAQNKYNIRVDNKEGIENYNSKTLGAKYLLIYGKEPITPDLWRIVEPAPNLVSKTELSKMGYPSEPKSENYLIFTLEPVKKNEFGFNFWDASKLDGYNKTKYRPFTTTLADLAISGVDK